MNQNEKKKQINKQTNHHALSKHKTSQEMTTEKKLQRRKILYL